MPSVNPRRNVLGLMPGRSSNSLRQARSVSTTQDSSRTSDDARASAMMHGQKPAGNGSQRHSNHDRTTDQQALLYRTSPFKQQFQRFTPQQQISNALPAHRARHTMSRKRIRRSEPEPDSRPARRLRTQDTSSEPLKDEFYIRETMDIPTRNDYTFLDGLNPSLKGKLHNALASFAETHTEYSVVGHNGIRCTLTCIFHESGLKEVVVGEHQQSKVGILAFY